MAEQQATGGWPSGRGRDGGIDEIPLPGVPGRLWLCGKHFIGPDVEAAVAGAMRATAVDDLADREVSELSGGQRQRVWAAMAVAQATPILLLDEPTTFLDIRHQIELLDVFAELNEPGRTIVAVLHDLNQAARYASHLVVMKDGRIVATGEPGEVLTAELVEEVYGLGCIVVADPVSGTPMVVPTAGRWRGRGRG